MRGLDFGAPSAERDMGRGLEKYFVESAVFHRVRSRAKTIILGNRGSGKSAIFKVLASRERSTGSHVIELAPEDYSYELLGSTMAAADAGSWAKHGAYAAAWKYLLCVLIMKGIAGKGGNGASKATYKYVRDNHPGAQAGKLEFRVSDANNQNCGVFVRFRDPAQDLPPQVLDRIVRSTSAYPNYPTDFQLFTNNRAWSAVYSRFEVQIDDNARSDRRRDFYGQPEPDGLRKNRTGAIYKIPAGDPIPGTNVFDAAGQQYQAAPNLVPGRWYQLQVDVQGDVYTVDLTDLQVGAQTRTTAFQNTDALRGVATEGNRPGYVGL